MKKVKSKKIKGFKNEKQKSIKQKDKKDAMRNNEQVKKMYRGKETE